LSFDTQFQTFDDPVIRPLVLARLAALRAELAARGLDGLVIPRADRHQNEYVPASEERLACITGFTGSAGSAIVLIGRAALFVDGRYTVQAAAQVDPDLIAVVPLAETTPEAWIVAHLEPGARLGFDPWLTTPKGVETLAAACLKADALLVPVEPNPVDAIWQDRPPAPLGAVVLHDAALAGRAPADKIADVRAALTKEKLDALVISDPHAMAWLFNMRGADVGHTPLPLGYALVPRDGAPRLFLDGRKMSNAVRSALSALADVDEPQALAGELATLSATGATIRLDSATASAALATLIEHAGGKVSVGADPIALMKAAKNEAEIAGTRAAHRRDGAAFVEFLAWFAAQPPGSLTEIDVVSALERCRRASGHLKDISFPTIAGSGPNGALPHYRVSRGSNRTLRGGELLVLDSGAQYLDGTTDITRTLAIGTPDPLQRDRATRVLKGHIAIATAVFPAGTSGAQLDSFARQFLWQAGLDFDHGTGHGVGSYLSVHEGPQRISKLGTTPLKRGMILSNEPGYYRSGAFGIRIENLILVREADAIAGAERTMDAFETLTLAPFDRTLIDTALLTAQERAWIDAYHRRVAEDLTPLVGPDAQRFLADATRPLD
jgi:Xaa-Pro aminopeptidase